MIIYLVRITSVKAVLEGMKKGKYKPKKEVIADSWSFFSSCEVFMIVTIFVFGVVIKLKSDAEVEAIAYGLTLKDPVHPLCSSLNLSLQVTDWDSSAVVHKD